MKLLKALIYLLFLSLNFYSVRLLAQCANFEIKVSKLDACAPEVIKYYVTNATFMGKDCQQGVYVYQIKAKSLPHRKDF